MKLHLKRWFLKGFAFWIVSTVLGIPLALLYGAFVLISPIVGIILILPVLAVAFVLKGFLLEWVNKVIK